MGESSRDTNTVYIGRRSSIVDAIRYTVTYGCGPSEEAPQPEALFYYEDYVTVHDLTVATHFRGYRSPLLSSSGGKEELCGQQP